MPRLSTARRTKSQCPMSMSYPSALSIYGVWNMVVVSWMPSKFHTLGPWWPTVTWDCTGKWSLRTAPFSLNYSNPELHTWEGEIQIVVRIIFLWLSQSWREEVRESAQQLMALETLPEDLNSISGIHIGWLITSCQKLQLREIQKVLLIPLKTALMWHIERQTNDRHTHTCMHTHNREREK